MEAEEAVSSGYREALKLGRLVDLNPRLCFVSEPGPDTRVLVS